MFHCNVPFQGCLAVPSVIDFIAIYIDGDILLHAVGREREGRAVERETNGGYTSL